MDGGTSALLATLTRRERAALRSVMVGAAARADVGGDPSLLQAMVPAAPMPALPEAARLHRLPGVVLRGLDGVEGVPDEARRQLASQRDSAAFNHLMTIGNLSVIARELDAADVSWVLMKGPVATGLLYREPGDRVYADIDLLVDRRHYGRAMEVLEALGFGHVIRDWLLAEQMLAGQVELVNGPMRIDLHWHLHYSREDRRPFNLDPDAMLARRRTVAVSGLAVPTLDPVDTLMTLAFHAARSDGHRLMWSKDLERSLAVEQPDLDELVRRSRAARCAPQVGVMLRRASVLLGAPVPDDVVAALCPRGLRLADRAITSVSAPIRFDEHQSLARFFTRSVRSSVVASLAAAPLRSLRSARRRLSPPPPNETDDPIEKASYVRAVAASR